MNELSPKERYKRAYSYIRAIVHGSPYSSQLTGHVSPDDLGLLITCNDHFHTGRKSPMRQNNHFGKICAFRKDLKQALEGLQ